MKCLQGPTVGQLLVCLIGTIYMCYHKYISDLESGVTLLILLEYLSGIQLKYHKTPKSNSQKLENLAIALEFMSSEGINLTAMCEY